MNNKLLSYILPISSVLTLILVAVLVFGGSSNKLGGTTNFDAMDVSDGYYVDGTQIIDGSGNWVGTGTFAITGDSRIKSPVLTGATSTLTAASTTVITAAQACDKSLVNFEPLTVAVGTTTLPTAEAVFADCLTTNGDQVSFYFRNLSSATTTIIAVASASTTLEGPAVTGANSTIGVSGIAKITLLRAAGNLMYAIVQEMAAITP